MGIDSADEFDFLRQRTLDPLEIRRHHRRFRRRAIIRTVVLSLALPYAAFMAFAIPRLVRDLAPVYFPPPDPPYKPWPEWMKSTYEASHPTDPPPVETYSPPTESTRPRQNSR